MDLRLYTDERPGITRRKQGRGFSYYLPDGCLITCVQERARIKALAIPPAYEDVWISPHPNGHLLATGRDEKGRKQYIYHEAWRASREREKFANLADIGAALPQLRRWVASRIAAESDDKETAIATALALIERGSLRPGSPCYTRENASYGATTLLPQHFTQKGSVSVLSYTAKGGQPVEKRVRGLRLAKRLARQKKRSSPKLVMWRRKNGEWRAVLPSDLNECLAKICGNAVSVKTLRTWNGTLAAFRAAQSAERLTKKMMAKAAADALHNTPAIAQKSYIHPAVLTLSEMSKQDREKRLAAFQGQARAGFRSGESALLALLQSD